MRLFVLILALVMGAQSAQAAVVGRNYLMGFSPWPYDYSVDAVTWTYSAIQEHGDIVSHHLDEGVPWDEALNGSPFPKGMTDDMNFRLWQTKPETARLLQVTPLSMGRDGLALRRGDKPNQGLSGDWSSRRLNDPEVKKAYLNYVERMNDMFKPTYLITGIESNLLIRKKPDAWNDYVDLQCSTYRSLKDAGVKAPILVSLVTVAFFPEWSSEDNLNAQLAGVQSLKGCVDGFALSAHPFMSGLLAETFPKDYFDRLAKYIPNIRGVAESSYPAQEWSYGTLKWNGSDFKQEFFLREMLEAASKGNYEFIVWFTARDYDALWANALGKSDQALVWRDTGLFDENGEPRSALHAWDRYFEKKPSRKFGQ